MQCLPLTSQEKLTYKANHSKAETVYHIPYGCHYNPLLIRNRSWILTIYKTKGHSRQMNFKKWMKNVKTTGYNDANTPTSFSFTCCIAIAWKNCRRLDICCIVVGLYQSMSNYISLLPKPDFFNLRLRLRLMHSFLKWELQLRPNVKTTTSVIFWILGQGNRRKLNGLGFRPHGQFK